AAGTVLEAMERHCPEIVSAVRRCFEHSRHASGEGYSQLELDAGTFADVPEDSLDYALMEKSRNVSVVPCTIGWSDIGSWSAIGDLAQADGNSNRIEAQAVLVDVEGCYIRSQDRLVG